MHMSSTLHCRCFFGDYMDSSGADPAERAYSQVPDASAAVSSIEEALTDFNATSKRPMHLAMFLFAVEHVSRICRWGPHIRRYGKLGIMLFFFAKQQIQLLSAVCDLYGTDISLLYLYPSACYINFKLFP
jgi:hypothetical protein